MKISKTKKIALKIILVFALAIFMSIIPDLYPDFFGDEICNGKVFNEETMKIEYFIHYGDRHVEVLIHWGYRHWLYFTMALLLAVVQFVDIVLDIATVDNNKN